VEISHSSSSLKRGTNLTLAPGKDLIPSYTPALRHNRGFDLTNFVERISPIAQLKIANEMK
jgi:hypothetical protein